MRFVYYLLAIIGITVLFIILDIPLSLFDKDILLYGDISYETGGKIIVEYRP